MKNNKGKTNIKVEETNLEDLIILGEDKLIDCVIDFPTENGSIKAKAKIKQLTMKELKNMDLQQPSFETNTQILCKSLYKTDNTPFTEDEILNMPLGALNDLSEEVMRLSGVDVDLKKF